RGRVEEHVPTGDERLDVLDRELLEETAQTVHLHGVTADVDGAEEGDVSRHGPNLRRKRIREQEIGGACWTSVYLPSIGRMNDGNQLHGIRHGHRQLRPRMERSWRDGCAATRGDAGEDRCAAAAPIPARRRSEGHWRPGARRGGDRRLAARRS